MISTKVLTPFPQLNFHAPTEDTHSSKRQKTRGRTITEIDTAPSVTDQLLDHEIREHAHTRIQIQFSRFISLYEISKRSDGTTVDANPTIEGATFQSGQAGNGRHAAHCDTSSGLLDGRRDQIVDEIFNENKITPLKKRILTAKGFSKEDLKALEKAENVDRVREVIERKWPQNSIISGSEFELQANATTFLHWRINLVVDKALENRYRNAEYLELYKKVMQGILTPDEAVEKYAELNRVHFEASCDEIHKKMDAFNTLIKGCEKIFNYEKSYRKNPKKFIQFEAEDYFETIQKAVQLISNLSKSSSLSPSYTLQNHKRYFIRMGSFIEQSRHEKGLKPAILAAWKKCPSPNQKQLKNELTEIEKKISVDQMATSEQMIGTTKAKDNLSTLTSTWKAEQKALCPISPNTIKKIQDDLLRTRLAKVTKVLDF